MSTAYLRSLGPCVGVLLEPREALIDDVPKLFERDGMRHVGITKRVFIPTECKPQWRIGKIGPDDRTVLLVVVSGEPCDIGRMGSAMAESDAIVLAFL